MNRRLLAKSPRGLSLVLVALVFAIDLSLPLGVASAVPYTFAVLLALTARPMWVGPAVAVLCGILTVAKMGIVPERGTTEMWKVVANRSLALFAIGMTAFLGVLRRRSEIERLRAEEQLREHQADLAHMARLSALGQVTATLAHELNQPLAAVCLQADTAARLAASNGSTQPELTRALEEIAEQSARAAEIVRGVRRMARRTGFSRDAIDLNETVRGVVRLLDWQASRVRVTVQLQLAVDPLEPVYGDRIQIEQVLFNLIQNAIEAASQVAGGPRTVTVETARQPGAVTVLVRDTGPGLIDPERVFERFYTTKPNGTGLGLAISRSIAEAHGGRLWTDPAPRIGAAFSFMLPAMPKENS